MASALHDAVRRIDTLVVVSPHFDDGVFSCADVLAAHPGARVVTVFAGKPAEASQLTEWDAKCGFTNAADAWEARQNEDRSALDVISARPEVLHFVDSQYGEPSTENAVGIAIEEVLTRLPASAVFIPLGLFHSDHLLTHRACIRACRRLASLCVAYEDALYRRLPGLVQNRLGQLCAAGIRATPVTPSAADGTLKQEAVGCYASQLRAFGRGGYDDLRLPERYWALELGAANAIAA